MRLSQKQLLQQTNNNKIQVVNIDRMGLYFLPANDFIDNLNNRHLSERFQDAVRVSEIT